MIKTRRSLLAAFSILPAVLSASPLLTAQNVAALTAQNVAALTDRLHAAEEETALDADGVTPWHLKLDVQLFDDEGKSAEQGSIEEWWVSKELQKITYSFPSYSGTVLRNQHGAFRTRDDAPRPWMLQDVLHQIVHPLNIGELAQVKPELREQKFGNVEMDCIMLDQPLNSGNPPPLGLFPTYCLDSGKNDLRITTEFGSPTFVRNRVGSFQNKSVAVELTGDSRGKTAATAHVSALSGAKLNESDFAESPEMEKTGAGVARINGNLITGSSISKIPPFYPDSAKRNHIKGTVLLHALIGTDGHIRSLHILSTPDPDLAISSIAAVRQWRYKPYLLNGLPTEVDTTITVNFRFN